MAGAKFNDGHGKVWGERSHTSWPVMCVNPAVESMGLALTSGERGKINEPFVFGQNNALSKSCVCSTRALCPQPRARHFCTCVTEGHRRRGPGSQAGAMAATENWQSGACDHWLGLGLSSESP